MNCNLSLRADIRNQPHSKTSRGKPSLSEKPNQISDREYLSLVSICLNEVEGIRILSKESKEGNSFWRLCFEDKFYSVVAGTDIHLGFNNVEPTIIFSWGKTPLPFLIAFRKQLVYFDLRFHLRSRHLEGLAGTINERLIAYGYTMNFYEAHRKRSFSRRALKYLRRKVRKIIRFVEETIPEIFASLIVRGKRLSAIESESISIRPARESDLPAINEMFRRTFLDHPDTGRMKFYLRKFNPVFLVAVAEERIIAFSFCSIKTRITRQGIELVGHFYDIAVLPEYRGRGIARKIQRVTIKRLREMGVRSATSYVYFDNERMKRIAEEAGLAPTGRSMGVQKEYSVNLDKYPIE